MRIIVKEFLSLLKESRELDRLLPDLLRMMNMNVLSEPQIGTRQFGVDVIAAGEYEDANSYIIFTIKEGDVDRNNWDNNNPQSIRPSLNEILDVKLKDIPSKYKNYKKIIVLATGGEIKQEIESNWNGFIEDNSKKYNINFEFWGGDKISQLIIEYMLNENIFSDKSRKLFRKSLALLGDVDYDLKDFYNLIDDILKNTKKNKKGVYSYKEILKSIRTTKLCLIILFYWSKEEDNIKPVYYAGEFCLMKTWNFIFKNDFNTNKKIINEFKTMYSIIHIINQFYLNQIFKTMDTNGGLNKYCIDQNSFNIIIFEQIGIISTMGLLYLHLISLLKEDNDFKKGIIKIINLITQYLKIFINEYRISSSPFYDSHMIEIGLSLIFLFLIRENNLIKKWIWDIVENTTYAFHIGKYFPICTDNFDDLISLNIEESISKNDLMKASTLFPMVVDWAIILNEENIYYKIQKNQKKLFSECTFQLWYPDQEAFNCFYEQNAADFKGYAFAPINLSDNIIDYKNQINEVYNKELKHKELSSIKYGIIGLEFMAHRHFRTPLCPSMWQQFIFEKIFNSK